MREKEIEIKELKEQLNELAGILCQSEARRRELEKQQKLREQAVAIALATSSLVSLYVYSWINILLHRLDQGRINSSSLTVTMKVKLLQPNSSSQI